MATEDVDPRFTDLDAWPVGSALAAMWEGQMAAVAALREALPQMEAAIGAASAALGEHGRLVYAGAGTSGRVAVQDGAELPPTFGWPHARIVFALAGGTAALTASIEGAEDDARDGAAQMDAAAINSADVVIGVAASGTTPFTIAAIERARKLGAVTIGIANNPGAPLLDACAFPVLVETGSEIVAGSTRMKAGTAQKAVLNLISTGIMLQLGRVYRGLMVNMQAANVKLERRAERMVASLAGCSVAAAAVALAQGGGDIKTAVLLADGLSLDDAAGRLAAAGGNLRIARG